MKMPSPQAGRVRLSCAWLCSILFCLSGAGIVWAGPFEILGLGGRGMAMGGAVTAIVEDYSAAFYNPAGLGFSDKPMLGGGFIYGAPDLELKGCQKAYPTNPLIRALQAGGSFPMGSKGFLSRFRM